MGTERKSTELKFISFIAITVLVWDIFSAQGLPFIHSIIILALLATGIILLFKKRSKLAGLYLIIGYSLGLFLYGAEGILVRSYRPSLSSLYCVICCLFIGGIVYAQQSFRTRTESSDYFRKTFAVIISITLLVIFSINFYPMVSCTFRGGEYTTGGLLDAEYCLYTYSDGGKPCSSSTECEGNCILPEQVSLNNNPVIGVCKSDNDPYGCYSSVEDGSVLGEICTD